MKNIEKRVATRGWPGGWRGQGWKVFPSVNVSYLTNDVAGCWIRCWMRMLDALLLTEVLWPFFCAAHVPPTPPIIPQSAHVRHTSHIPAAFASALSPYTFIAPLSQSHQESSKESSKEFIEYHGIVILIELFIV